MVTMHRYILNTSLRYPIKPSLINNFPITSRPMTVIIAALHYAPMSFNLHRKHPHTALPAIINRGVEVLSPLPVPVRFSSSNLSFQGKRWHCIKAAAFLM